MYEFNSSYMTFIWLRRFETRCVQNNRGPANGNIQGSCGMKWPVGLIAGQVILFLHSFLLLFRPATFHILPGPLAA